MTQAARPGHPVVVLPGALPGVSVTQVKLRSTPPSGIGTGPEATASGIW